MSNRERLRFARDQRAQLAGWNDAQLRGLLPFLDEACAPQAPCSPSRDVSAISSSSLFRACWTHAVMADPAGSVRATPWIGTRCATAALTSRLSLSLGRALAGREPCAVPCRRGTGAGRLIAHGPQLAVEAWACWPLPASITWR